MVQRLAALAVLLLPLAALAADARTAVESFVSRVAGAQVNDLAIEQTFTLFSPDGRQPQSSGEQRISIKVPGRQRIEWTSEGGREVRLSIGNKTWARAADGKVTEAPRDGRDGDRTNLLMPFRRTAADVLAEWRSLGIRDDVSHEAEVSRGRTVTVIGARPGDRDTPAVWIDPQFGVVRFIRHERLPKGDGTVRDGLIDLAFSEHRPLAGKFYFPYRQEAFVDGKLLVLIVVRSAAVNTGLADALFDPDALRRAP